MRYNDPTGNRPGTVNGFNEFTLGSASNDFNFGSIVGDPNFGGSLFNSSDLIRSNISLGNSGVSLNDGLNIYEPLGAGFT